MTANSPALRALWAGMPDVLLPVLEQRATASDWTAAHTLRFLDQHALRTPVWLRLLNDKAESRLGKELTFAGFRYQSHGPALQVSGERGVYELESYRRGDCEIQDLASQAIGEAVAPAPGHLIWDCCAGAGGKTVQLGAALRGQGLVFATDVQAGKLKDLAKRVKRAGLTNVRSLVWDGKTAPDFGPEVQRQGGFDRVLVDAPCSGSGTWRRNVDGRLRFDPAQIADRTVVQRHLLAVAAASVHPGGSLIYATCSWLPAENEEVVAAFCADQPPWRCVASKLSGNPWQDSDTTFWARLRRE
jgi:16S rRNA (cytosine967-C5)-methyltransferase